MSLSICQQMLMFQRTENTHMGIISRSLDYSLDRLDTAAKKLMFAEMRRSLDKRHDRRSQFHGVNYVDPLDFAVKEIERRAYHRNIAILRRASRQQKIADQTVSA